jgi:PAS domain S-box-containing protein
MNRPFQRLARWALGLLCALVSFSPVSHVHGADTQGAKRVLMISTGSRLSVGFPIVEHNLLDTLRQLQPGQIDLFAESLDIIRFPRESYRRVFHDYLRDKYADDNPNLIILIYVGNLDVAERVLEQLFPGAPVVAVGLTEEDLPLGRLGGRVAAIAQRSDPGGTIQLILRLQPDTQRIVLIGGTAEVDRNVMSRARQASRSFAERVKFEVWDNLSMQEILKAVTSLPPRTVILFTRMFRDGAGRAIISAPAARSIAKVANVPVYVMADPMLGTGAVGGSAVDIASLGKRAGELAHRILSGTKPASMPLEIINKGAPIFDWRALQRWGISESRLPKDSIIRFRPVSMWTEYNSYIIGGLIIIALQAAMIAALLLQRARRRRVEAKLRESQEFMELATNAGELGLWMRDIKKGDVWVNVSLRLLFGFGANDLLRFDDVVARIHPDDRAHMLSELERAQAAALPFKGEFRILHPGGYERWVLAIGRTVVEPRDRAERRMGVIVDITERKRAEQALRESEERFRIVANAAPVMIWMSGPDKSCTFFNKGWLDFTGRTFEQELGNGWLEGVHREDFDRCLESYSKAFDARQEFTMEYRLRRFDGEYCAVLDHGVPRFDADGTFLGYIGTAIDITELKRGEEKFRLAVEASPSAIVMVNEQGKIVLVNAETEKLFDYSREELIGRFVEMLVPERLRGGHPAHRGEFLAAPQVRSVGAGRDLFARRKDGSEVMVEIALNPIQTQEGLFVLTVIVDVSARKQAEEALNKERAFLRQVIDVDPNFIFAKDREGRFTLVNQATADAYGTTVDDLIGKTDADFNSNGEEVEFFRRMDLEVMETLQERFIPEEHITDARGKVRWLQTVKRPIVEKDGSANQVLGASTDITRRKETELELVEQRAQLAHVTRLSTMGELAASLAHELNQPLTAILSNAQAALRFMSSKPADLEEVREILKDIVQDNNRAGEVIRRMRALVKKEKLEFVALELTSLVCDVVALVHSDAILQSVRILLQFNDNLPPVRGDRVQLQQVVLNLLLNAFDAMKDCPVNAREITMHAQRDGAGLVRVAVRDRGTGLSSDKLDKIFQPFYTTKGDGLGMGLSICRSIIEAHGGHLWAENNPDRGATFNFTVAVAGKG